jgi:LPXTG-site transpeptidase (sortase) family protein
MSKDHIKEESSEEIQSKITIRNRFKKMSKVDKLILGVAILFFLAGAVLLVWQPVENYFREQKMLELLDAIEEGEPTFIVDRDAFVVPGEGFETFGEETQNTSEIEDETILLPEDVVLTAIGTMRIDEIDLFLPVLDSAKIVPLRYGAGMLEGTALPGQEGNCVILGHRMKAYGSLFNRLAEISIGDTIVISTIDKEKYTYVVDKIIMKLKPSELTDYIDITSGNGIQMTLVTCTPTGVGSHRLIIVAHLEE